MTTSNPEPFRPILARIITDDSGVICGSYAIVYFFNSQYYYIDGRVILNAAVVKWRYAEECF